MQKTSRKEIFIYSELAKEPTLTCCSAGCQIVHCTLWESFSVGLNDADISVWWSEGGELCSELL